MLLSYLVSSTKVGASEFSNRKSNSFLKRKKYTTCVKLTNVDLILIISSIDI